MERTPRRGNRKVIPLHHPSRALSCVPPQPWWPPFLHYFFICQCYWGRRWSGDITCPFIEMKQTLFSPFNLSHPPTQSPPPPPELSFEMARDMSLLHQTAAGNSWEEWQTLLLQALTWSHSILSDLSVCTWPFNRKHAALLTSLSE